MVGTSKTGLSWLVLRLLAGFASAFFFLFRSFYISDFFQELNERQHAGIQGRPADKVDTDWHGFAYIPSRPKFRPPAPHAGRCPAKTLNFGPRKKHQSTQTIV